MNRATSFTRTGLLAVLMAMVGFSYALATSNSSNFSSDNCAANDLAERAASGVYNKPGGNIPLSFANPFCTDGSTDRDLGDATFGSALTRLVRAKGGVAPYKFTSTAGTELGGLKLLLNGILTGTPTGTAPTVGSTQVRFDVTVFDSFGSNAKKTEKFRLTYFATSQFRFAHDKLSDGVQFTSFSGSLYVLNGSGAKFATTGTALSDLGLNLASDGAVYGTPLKAGTFTFVATATKGGNTAAGRNGTGNSQTITIKISGSKSLQSLISATSITIKSGNGSDKKGVGKDSIQYKGVANVPLASLSGLSGDVSIRVGAYTSPAITFSGKGKASTGGKGVTPAGKASVSSSGAISIGVTKDSIHWRSQRLDCEVGRRSAPRQCHDRQRTADVQRQDRQGRFHDLDLQGLSLNRSERFVPVDFSAGCGRQGWHRRRLEGHLHRPRSRSWWPHVGHIEC